MEIPSSSQAPTIDVKSISSILECALCLCVVCEPISISCGHTFCRVCLVKALRRLKKRCPTCREICHIAPETYPENIMIRNLAMSIDPDSYTARLAESVVEKSSWSTVYPIFYYNTAMFPGSKLSLHLFEPRYKLMMQRVVNSTKAFAYVPNFTSYHAQLGDVALVAKLKEVEFLPDGRCLLESVLTGRYKIVDHYVEDGTQGLHFCRLEVLQDTPLDAEGITQAQTLAVRGQELANFIIDTTTSKASVEMQFGPMPAPDRLEDFSLWLAALCPISETAKAQLLSSTNTMVRLQRCVEGLQSYVNSINSRRQAAAVLTAAGNTVSTATATLGSFITSFLGRQQPQQRAVTEEEEEEERELQDHLDDTMIAVSGIQRDESDYNDEEDEEEGEEEEDLDSEEDLPLEEMDSDH